MQLLLWPEGALVMHPEGSCHNGKTVTIFLGKLINFQLENPCQRFSTLKFAVHTKTQEHRSVRLFSSAPCSPPPLSCTRQRIYRARLLEQRLVANKCHLPQAWRKILLSCTFDLGHKQWISISKVQNLCTKTWFGCDQVSEAKSKDPSTECHYCVRLHLIKEYILSTLRKYSNKLKKSIWILRTYMHTHALLLSVCVCVHVSMLAWCQKKKKQASACL